MSRKPPLPPDFDENPEWTEEDFRTAIRPEDMPPEILAAFPNTSRRSRGPQKAPTKVPVSLRLSPDVLAKLKEAGPGWQTRVDEVLRKAVGLD